MYTSNTDGNYTTKVFFNVLIAITIAVNDRDMCAGDDPAMNPQKGQLKDSTI